MFISDVVEGSVAAKCAKLRQGDQILAVNGEDLRNASQERGAQALKVCLILYGVNHSPQLGFILRYKEMFYKNEEHKLEKISTPFWSELHSITRSTVEI